MEEMDNLILINGEYITQAEVRRRLTNCQTEYHDVIMFLHEFVSEDEPRTLEDHRAMRNILKDRVQLMMKRLASYINPPSEFRS